jgi:hypothetical protein
MDTKPFFRGFQAIKSIISLIRRILVPLYLSSIYSIDLCFNNLYYGFGSYMFMCIALCGFNIFLLLTDYNMTPIRGSVTAFSS